MKHKRWIVGAGIMCLCAVVGVLSIFYLHNRKIDAKDNVRIAQAAEGTESQPCSYVGFTDRISMSSVIPFHNDEYNEDSGYYLSCAIEDGGRVLYDSGYIAPGDDTTIRVAKVIKKEGTYTIKEQAYVKQDNGMQKISTPVVQDVYFYEEK